MCRSVAWDSAGRSYPPGRRKFPLPVWRRRGVASVSVGTAGFDDQGDASVRVVTPAHPCWQERDLRDEILARQLGQGGGKASGLHVEQLDRLVDGGGINGFGGVLLSGGKAGGLRGGRTGWRGVMTTC